MIATNHPLILAIESSCDETAAAVIDGGGVLRSDVVATQVDFHARFGGVVPEIASRKHIEAICGVCDEALDVAAASLGRSSLRWRDLDAVAVTYAPGLVGALVVGVAFAKGAAWGADIPFIVVNHLEGHLYANKIGLEDFAPPAVVSLVSGATPCSCIWPTGAITACSVRRSTMRWARPSTRWRRRWASGYPGGGRLEVRRRGRPGCHSVPRAMLHSGDLRFSLSGLKTAVVT